MAKKKHVCRTLDGTLLELKLPQDGPKMAPRWPQDGVLEGLGATWRARWPEDGAKRVSMLKKAIRAPHVGAQVGTQFWAFLAPEWITRGLNKHLDDMLCQDTNF